MVYELAEALNRFDAGPSARPTTMNDRTFSRILLTLGVLSALTLAWFAWVGRFPVPYRDDWDWLNWVLVAPISLPRLFQPHNEHLIPLPRLLSWVNYRIGGANGHLLFWLAVVAQTATVLFLVGEARRRWRETPVLRQSMTGLLLVILTFAWQLQSLVFAAAVLFPMVQALATFAVAAAVTAADPSRRHSSRTGWLAATFGLSLAAMLTTSNGLAVPIVLAMLATARRESRTVILAHVAMALTGVAAFAWLVLRSSAAGAVSPVGHAWAIVAYFTAFFAPFLTYLHEGIGAIAGALLFAAGAGLVVRTWRHGRGATRVEQIVAGLLLFAMASGGMAALGRARFGLDQAAQSRYATFALTYWAALLIGFTEWRADRLVRPRGSLPRLLVVGGTTAVLVADVFTGAVWWAKARNVAAAGLAVGAGVRDDEWTETLHPLPHVVYDVVALARAHGDASLLDPAIGTTHGAGAIPACRGSLTASRAPRGDAVRLTGTIADEATTGVVVDADAIVIGLIGRAPLVSAPNPSRSQVTQAVIQALRDGDWRSSAWLGFARPARQTTVTAIFSGTDGDVCRLAVTAADRRGRGAADSLAFHAQGPLDPSIRYEPRDRDHHVDSARQRRTPEGQSNGNDVVHEGNLAFEIVAQRNRQPGSPFVERQQSACQDEISDSGHQQNEAVGRHGRRREMRLAHPRGCERDERQPEQQVQVRP